MLVTAEKFGKEERAAVTSLDIAETFGKSHYHVLEDIRNLKGKLSSPVFAGLFMESSYIGSNGKKLQMYIMGRDGFTLIVMGYTGEKALQYKLMYIAQFNAMENQIYGKRIEREKGIAVRQSLTKALQQSNENDRMHGHAYSNYTNCIYKILFNMNASQLREYYKIDKRDNLRDCFTAEELQQIQTMESLVGNLIDCGWSYEQIKPFIETTNVKVLNA